jgi:hypothetical protein
MIPAVPFTRTGCTDTASRENVSACSATMLAPRISLINAFNRINLTTRAVLDPSGWAEEERVRTATR